MRRSRLLRFSPRNTPLFSPPTNCPRCYAFLMELPSDRPDQWTRVSRLGGSLCLALYLLFLLYAWRDRSGFLFLDFANLVIHEAGHPFFSYFGHTPMILGGTLGELIVPLLCAAFFFFRRQTYGLVFSLFWFFENFLYIGTYMADARTRNLPLVNSDESDWTILFGQWGVLLYDQKIGHFTRQLGWLGMICVVAWLAYRIYRDSQPEPQLRPLEM
jgi:hypothetical protein